MTVFRPRARLAIHIICISYYIVASLSSLFVTGDTTITYLYWLMILIATTVLNNAKAMAIGCLYFFGTMICLALFGSSGTGSLAVADIAVSSLLTICTACFISWIHVVNLVRFNTYEQIKNRERMQRDRLLAVINNINDAIISLTPRGIIKLYNSATMNLLDTNTTLNGKQVDSVLNLVDQDGSAVKITDIINPRKTIERDDLVHVFEDGQKISLYLACSPVRQSYGDTSGSENSGMIIVLRDVTKAKSLDEERDEFISVVSHELRTPVTIAEGSISNLQELTTRGMIQTDTFSQALQSAYEQVLFLAKMVNDLSTLSRAERGAESKAEVIDIRELLNSMYETYQGDATKKGLRIDLDVKNVKGKIKASRLYVEEILQNFITNAIKYTKEGSVTIRANVDKDKVTFAVSDTGIGISRTDQKRIFDKFYRSEDYRTRESNGTGLGLYVTHKLSKLLNTHIYFESKLNHGSTFSFNLPLYKPKQPDDQK
ncbi:MAG: hypothetical protein LBG75_03055 [Candidatus Nomurabacteria bacterium]|nr:hypothetical protein [Candidatus Nomurabacteria bacterium]